MQPISLKIPLAMSPNIDLFQPLIQAFLALNFNTQQPTISLLIPSLAHLKPILPITSSILLNIHQLCYSLPPISKLPYTIQEIKSNFLLIPTRTSMRKTLFWLQMYVITCCHFLLHADLPLVSRNTKSVFPQSI